VQASFGPHAGVQRSSELSGGGFATVMRVDLCDGRNVVLKVAPPPGVPLLRYEYGVIGAEARYLQLVGSCLPDVPVPRLLHYGDDPEVLDSAWLFTSYLPGATLAQLREAIPPGGDHAVRADLGAVVASLHTVCGDRYGYDGSRPHGSSWREAFTTMVHRLLDDAEDWEVELGASPARIRELLARHGGALDQVRRPTLLHFDLWDGNLICGRDADGRLRLRGLVDGERYLYGDPLMDFGSPALYRNIEDEPHHPFIRGYGLARGRPVVFGTAARQRLTMYRLHMYLLMTIEMPSRGMTRQTRPDRFEVLGPLVDRQLAEMSRW